MSYFYDSEVLEMVRRKCHKDRADWELTRNVGEGRSWKAFTFDM
jgi:hypothetical protein